VAFSVLEEVALCNGKRGFQILTHFVEVLGILAG